VNSLGSPAFDAAVIGGGPAGAVAARLLAAWGHRTVLLARADAHRPAVAESLPPSIRKLLGITGQLDAVDQAGFYRSRGNTVWWERTEARIESFQAEALGYQVVRPKLDGVLLDQACRAGADARRGAAVRTVVLGHADGGPARIEYETTNGRDQVVATWVLDASGRTSLLARALDLRRPEEGQRTLALIGEWRNPRGWDVPDPTHTLVEGYRDGWAWSVPVSDTVRQVAVMVDPRRGVTALSPDRHAAAMYHAELAKTSRLSSLAAAATMTGLVGALDASLYDTIQSAGPGFLLVGDAASFVDPLSSIGVKKALASAWLGAVVTHTALVHPSMTPHALDLFNGREHEMYGSMRRLTAEQFGRAAGDGAHRFWSDRIELPTMDDPGDSAWPGPDRGSAIRDALEQLKRAPRIRLMRSGRWRTVTRPAVREREVMLEERLEVGRGRALRYLRGVDIVALGGMAGQFGHVPDMFEAYNRAHRPAALPDFLAVLATLVAEGMLENQVPV
jgi:flavin-dependent dehydrogenase